MVQDPISECHAEHRQTIKKKAMSQNVYKSAQEGNAIVKGYQSERAKKVGNVPHPLVPFATLASRLAADPSLFSVLSTRWSVSSKRSKCVSSSSPIISPISCCRPNASLSRSRFESWSIYFAVSGSASIGRTVFTNALHPSSRIHTIHDSLVKLQHLTTVQVVDLDLMF